MESLEQRVAELEERVARLEAGPEPVRPPGNEIQAPLEALEGLRARVGERYTRDGRAGAVMYAGAVRVEGREYLWAKEHSVPDVAEEDWGTAARLLESLGSPSRLALLAALLDGPRTRRRLQEALGETSTGHLYHHLKELHATGLLLQRKRGVYELAPHTVVPLLVILAAAFDLGAGATTGAEPGEGPGGMAALSDPGSSAGSAASEATESEATESEATGSEATGSEATGSEDAGPEDAGPEDGE